MKSIKILLIVVFLGGCGGPFTVRHFQTENMPGDQVGVLYVSDGIMVTAIDNRKVKFSSIGGGFDVHLKPGWHRLTVRYYKHEASSGYHRFESTGTVTVQRYFQKGRKYYLASVRSGKNRSFYINVYAKKGTMVKGVQPLPDSASEKWGRANIMTEKKVYGIDENIVVYFRNCPGNKKDWLNIVPSGAPDNYNGHWKYLRGAGEGSLMFSGKSPGNYEVRLHHDWPRGKYIVHETYRFSVKR